MYCVDAGIAIIINHRLMEKALLDEAKGKSIKAGDWRVIFHVIEVRELHPEDVSGLSDPVCQVEVTSPGVKSVKRCTRIVKAVRSCVFDETLFLDMKVSTVFRIALSWVFQRCE
jgi:Ca2+-dependent lipid-binding protein